MIPSVAILTIQIRSERDVVLARQRARQLASLLRFDETDQIRIATSVSELVRNCYQYVGSGNVEFSLRTSSRGQSLSAVVKDKGPGIPNLQEILRGQYVSKTGMGVGLIGAKKLMDEFSILSSPQEGTVVTLAKYLPRHLHLQSPAQVTALTETLRQQRNPEIFDEIKQQNLELLQALEAVREKQEELANLNRELSETNRGVVALYAELDEKAASLQKANEIKTSFLSNMTHEFRTPLTSIMSLSRLLLDHMDGDLTEEQERQVRYIRQSAEGLLELVNDLLDLAKVEAGKIAIKVSDFDLSFLFGAIRGVFRPLMTAETAVNLEFEVENGLSVHSDEAKVAQILRNLISNALKCTEKGNITVRARADEGKFLFISVQDTGIGIAPEHKELIFKDFTQIDSNLQRRARGTGLGLPLSRKLAQLLGGDLWVESKPGQGSTFFLRIPRYFQGGEEGVLFGNSTAKKECTPFRVLIVDSDEASRYLLRSSIQSLTSASFSEVALAEEAIGKAREFLPQAIFLDLVLPDGNGFDLIRQLKSDERLSQIPIFVNTARILNSDEQDILSQLTAGWISKNSEDNERSLLKVLKDAGLAHETKKASSAAADMRLS